MSNDLFNPTNATPAAEFDPVAEAMKQANLSGSGREKYLPVGKGEFEIERLTFGVSPKNGALRMIFVLKCVTHTDPKYVGKPFEHKINYVGTGKRTLSMVLADFAKWLVLPFGAPAKAALQTDAIKALIVKSYKEQFKTIIETQSLAAGQPYAGKRIALDVVANPTTVKDQATGQDKTINYTNVYIDAVAA
jgi:hypothetical protein